MKNTGTQNYEDNSQSVQSNTGGGIVMTNDASTDNSTQNENENDTNNDNDQSTDQSTDVGSGISMDMIIFILALVALYIYNKKYRK